MSKKLSDGTVIIVAGSANTLLGKLSGKHKRRLNMALEYLKVNPQTKIVVTGGAKPGRGKSTEAALGAAYLESKGISQHRIIRENRSGSTYGNFVNGLPLAKKAGAKSLFVISDFSHMRRCLALAYAANKRMDTSLPIVGADWYKDRSRQDATVSQATTQARVAWRGMTAEIVLSLDSRWGITPRRTLRSGNFGEDVKLVQKIVGAKVDGVYGPETKRCVAIYQNIHRIYPLPGDGIVGPHTWAYIDRNTL